MCLQIKELQGIAKESFFFLHPLGDQVTSGAIRINPAMHKNFRCHSIPIIPSPRRNVIGLL
ncbi:hypothetical cytosolic protein [Syntrophus aciditrophicus SB]|uniref:Hypothetical cytosolic protein n=1 Tax=Syntrophus aciditrophicus (strain SB) TaxID=56780 RepID=Q2LXE1_SYNAS|nr:hypothetical cytosolic protein [Syntrophus aciditrophicus SB]